jgi:hypothetical protein
MTFRHAMERLRKRTQMPLFVSAVWDAGLDGALRGAGPEKLFEGCEVRDPRMAACVVAGLHLWNDDFHASHNLCQGIETDTGSYWHGLCHRREGHRGEGLASNLGNAKYWFRRVGDHPTYDAVYRSALTVLDNSGSGFRWATEAAGALRANRRWDPFALIDWFGQADAGTLSAQSAATLEEIQWREIDILTDWCVEQALRVE